MDLLAACVPRPGQPDLRGWEWHYLDRLMRGSRFTYALGGTPERRRVQPGWPPLGRGSSDTTVKILNVATGIQERTLQGHTSGVGSVAFSPDGQRLASGGFDQQLKVWDAGTGRELFNLTGHASKVLGVKFTPDGQRLALPTSSIWSSGTFHPGKSFGPSWALARSTSTWTASASPLS